MFWEWWGHLQEFKVLWVVNMSTLFPIRWYMFINFIVWTLIAMYISQIMKHELPSSELYLDVFHHMKHKKNWTTFVICNSYMYNVVAYCIRRYTYWYCKETQSWRSGLHHKFFWFNCLTWNSEARLYNILYKNVIIIVDLVVRDSMQVVFGILEGFLVFLQKSWPLMSEEVEHPTGKNSCSRK